MPRVTLTDDYFGSGFAHVKGRTIDVDPETAKKLIDRSIAREPKPDDPDEVIRVQREAETADNPPDGETADAGPKPKKK